MRTKSLRRSAIILKRNIANLTGDEFKVNIPESVAMRCPVCVKPMKLEGTGFNSTGTHHRFFLCCDDCKATVVMDVFRGLSALVPPNPERLPWAAKHSPVLRGKP